MPACFVVFHNSYKQQQQQQKKNYDEGGESVDVTSYEYALVCVCVREYKYRDFHTTRIVKKKKK